MSGPSSPTSAPTPKKSSNRTNRRCEADRAYDAGLIPRRPTATACSNTRPGSISVGFSAIATGTPTGGRAEIEDIVHTAGGHGFLEDDPAAADGGYAVLDVYDIRTGDLIQDYNITSLRAFTWLTECVGWTPESI